MPPRSYPNLGVAAEACKRFGPILLSVVEGDRRVAVQAVCDHLKDLDLPQQNILSPSAIIKRVGPRLLEVAGVLCVVYIVRRFSLFR